ncbi:MAG: class I SAM-dependent methyltransferase [Acidimicrobiia bacterium]
MESARLSRTYEFWGRLMVEMHDDAYLTRINYGRADWIESLDLGPKRRVLDLGCGNGYLDIELAHRGHTVTAVDMVEDVIDSARSRVVDEPVTFIASDLRQVQYPDESFDIVLMFGLVGLMGREDDRALLARAHQWLAPGGSLLVESDLQVADAQTVFTDHPDGRVHWVWTGDAATRTNFLRPEFHRHDGTVIELRDPIDPGRGDHTGLIRYLYPPDELQAQLEASGFIVERIGHFLEYVLPDVEPDRFMLMGTRPSRSG